MRKRLTLVTLAVLPAALAGGGSGRPDTAPAARFILVGDTGTGNERARRVAAGIRRTAEQASVSHVFLLGDNVYEHGEARFIESRFLDVYRGVLSLGVRIHAALGNHDVERCRESGLRPVPRDGTAYAASPGCDVDVHLATREFGYRQGLRYYSVEIPGNGPTGPSEIPLVEAFVLDSNTLGEDETRIDDGTDEPQLRWIAEALRGSRARWKVVVMHGTMYTPKRCHWLGLICRGDDEGLRSELEPIFTRHGVDAVFQGHQHFYARLKPQRGIRYFVTGAGGKKPDSARTDDRAVRRRDRGAFNHFMYVYATEDRFHYCAIDAVGNVRDRGGFGRGDAAGEGFESGFCAEPR